MRCQSKLIHFDPRPGRQKAQKTPSLPFLCFLAPVPGGSSVAQGIQATQTTLLFLTVFLISVIKNPTPKLILFSGKKALDSLFQSGYFVFLPSKLFPKAVSWV